MDTTKASVADGQLVQIERLLDFRSKFQLCAWFMQQVIEIKAHYTMQYAAFLGF